MLQYHILINVFMIIGYFGRTEEVKEALTIFRLCDRLCILAPFLWFFPQNFLCEILASMPFNLCPVWKEINSYSAKPMSRYDKAHIHPSIEEKWTSKYTQ